MSDEIYLSIAVILILSALIAMPFIIYKFYKIVNYLLTKSKYRNCFLFLVCGMFVVDFIYCAYFGFGIINTDPMTINARIGSVFGAIFFGLIAIQNIIRNANTYFKSKLDAIIKLLLS